MLGLAHAPFGWRLTPASSTWPRSLAPPATRPRSLACSTWSNAKQPTSWATPTCSGRARRPRSRRDDRHPQGPGGARWPFYLELGFEEPHRPYDFGGAEPDRSRGVAIPGYLPQAPEAEADLAAFQGAIRQMDRGVGRVLAALDDLELASTTLVVFATDHGAAMPRAKCTLYDPGIEVVLLMRWPRAA